MTIKNTVKNYFLISLNQKQLTRRKKLETFLPKENNGKDTTDGILDFLAKISDSVQEEFDKLVSGNSDKKRFVRALSRIFALLLNTKFETAEKVKRILKIAIETTIKIWQKPREQ